MAERLVVRTSLVKQGLWLLVTVGMLGVAIWGRELGAIPE